LSKNFFVFLLFGLLSLGMTFPLLLNIADHVPSDFEDPLYNVWVLAWDFRGLSTGFKNFWDANIFYPHQGTLLYADNMLALGFLGAPIAAVSGNFILTHNILFILSFFLCGAGMYCLVLHLTRSRVSAFISGLIFAFFPYRFAHLSHLELLSFGWIPFCFLCLHKFFENPSSRNLAGIAAFYILQALSCGHYGLYLTLFVGFFVLFFAYKKSFCRRKNFWLKMGILSVACLLILLPLFYPYLKVHREMAFKRTMASVVRFSPQLENFLAVPPSNLAWGWLAGRLQDAERQLFPGIIPLFLTLFWLIKGRKIRREEPHEKRKKVFFWWDVSIILFLGFIAILGLTGGTSFWLGGLRVSIHRLRNPIIILAVLILLRIAFDKRAKGCLRKSWQSLDHAQQFYFAALIFAWILSFGPMIKFLGQEIIEGPYLILYKWIPGFSRLRVPGRLEVIMMLGLSVLAGWGAKQLIDISGKKSMKIFLAFALSGLILAEYASIPVRLVPVKVGKEIPPIYFSVKKIPSTSALIELPMPRSSRENSREAIYIYYSIYHWKRLVNGYSGYSPPGYFNLMMAMEFFPYERAFDILENLKVEYILIHTRGFRAEKGKEMVELLQNFKDKVELIEEVEGDYLYRLHLSEKRESR